MQVCPARLQESLASGSKVGCRILDLLGQVGATGSVARMEVEITEKIVPTVA